MQKQKQKVHTADELCPTEAESGHNYEWILISTDVDLIISGK